MAFDTAKNTRNRDAEKAGVWMDYDEDTRFLVARDNNPGYKQFVSKRMRENKQLMEGMNTKQAEKVAEQIMLEATAKHLLKDWEGMLSGGVKLKFSIETAIEVLEEHDDLKKLLDGFASDRSNFTQEQDAKDVAELGK